MTSDGMAIGPRVFRTKFLISFCRFASPLSRFQDGEDDDVLSLDLVGLADDSSLGYGRVLLSRSLDLGIGDPVARHLQDIVGSAHAQM